MRTIVSKNSLCFFLVFLTGAGPKMNFLRAEKQKIHGGSVLPASAFGDLACELLGTILGVLSFQRLARVLTRKCGQSRESALARVANLSDRENMFFEKKVTTTVVGRNSCVVDSNTEGILVRNSLRAHNVLAWVASAAASRASDAVSLSRRTEASRRLVRLANKTRYHASGSMGRARLHSTTPTTRQNIHSSIISHAAVGS